MHTPCSSSTRHLHHAHTMYIIHTPHVYASTHTGSRNGGLISTAWAAMVLQGWEGYKKTADIIMKVWTMLCITGCAYYWGVV